MEVGNYLGGFGVDLSGEFGGLRRQNERRKTKAVLGPRGRPSMAGVEREQIGLFRRIFFFFFFFFFSFYPFGVVD